MTALADPFIRLWSLDSTLGTILVKQLLQFGETHSLEAETRAWRSQLRARLPSDAGSEAVLDPVLRDLLFDPVEAPPSAVLPPVPTGVATEPPAPTSDRVARGIGGCLARLTLLPLVLLLRLLAWMKKGKKNGG